MTIPLLEPQPLTAEAFALYGQLLGRPERRPDIEDGGWLSYWHTLAHVGFTREPVWGFLEMQKREPVLARMERHVRAHEVFIPMGGVSLMPFALGGKPDDPESKPDPETLKLFIIDGSQALIVGRGVWHTPSYPVQESAGFLLALEAETPSSDLDFRPIGPYRVSQESLLQIQALVR